MRGLISGIILGVAGSGAGILFIIAITAFILTISFIFYYLISWMLLAMLSMIFKFVVTKKLILIVAGILVLVSIIK